MEDQHSPKRRRLSPPNSAAHATAPAAPGDAGSPGATQQQQHQAAAARSDSNTIISSVQAFDTSQRSSRQRRSPSRPQVPSEGPTLPTSQNHLQQASALDPAAKVASWSATISQAQQKTNPQDTIDPPNLTQPIERIRDLSFTARKSPAKPNPRPLPPPAPEGEDELTAIRLALGKNARWSPRLGLSPSQPEPELPPSVPDIVSSTPPRGIHSSPSRWRSKSRSRSKNQSRDKAKKSSPLKPKMDRPGLKAELSLRGVGPRTGLEKVDAPPPFPLDERSHPARQVPAHDADVDKRKERDALRDEVARLRQDLQVVNKENEHIRLMQTSGRVISSQDEDAVLDVIQRHMVDAENPAPPPASQQLVKAALSSAGLGLLPFTRPTPLVAAPEEQDFSDIKSHRPVPMTAEEELPYLQLFSPFAVTSTIAVLPQLPNQPLRQRRTMTFRPKDGLGLFTARVEMVIDALGLSILELKVPALEPAARAELAPFADRICQGDCNRSMQRNVGILSWAMGEWYRVALRRARLWSQLESELAAKGGVLQATAEMRQRKKRRRRDEESDGEENAPAAVAMEPAPLRHLLGQQFFDLSIPPREASDPSSSLRLEWKIEFDWTGEAQSRVACLVGVPGKWRHADQRDVLGKLPHLFQTLVEGGEDLSVAAKTMAALLAGDRGDSTD